MVQEGGLTPLPKSPPQPAPPTRRGLFHFRPELVTLELRDAVTGRPLSQKDYYASYGKAVVQPLLIRSGGAYTVRLVVDGVEHDTCRFTVERSGPTPVLNGPR